MHRMHSAKLILITLPALIPSVFFPGGTCGNCRYTFPYALHLPDTKAEDEAAGKLHSDEIAFVYFNDGVVVVFPKTTARRVLDDRCLGTGFTNSGPFLVYG